MTLPLPLPIDVLLPDIVAALRTNPCLVLEAEAGAGKTTRVPPALLRGALGDGAANSKASEVWVAEPRRLAARLAATRVAEELGEPLGRTVGYHVRFENVAGRETRLRFMTEGVLIRRLMAQPQVGAAKIIILDEFHERHFETDLALALLRHLQQSRHDLKLVVMSATLDGEAIARFLGDCPRLMSRGRAHPLRIEYQPEQDERPLEKQVTSAVRRCFAESPQGDVLVFLPGATEIQRATRALEGLAHDAGALVLPLHGDLRLEQQTAAIAPNKQRKIVLSTNVAESSVTVPGVTCVVDSGLAKTLVHSPWTGLASLSVTKVSRASATQRAGRAGRTGPGKVLRLYTRGDFEGRPEQDAPEILRSDLSEGLLTLAALGFSSPEQLSWLTPPSPSKVAAARELLTHLGAMDDDGSITDLGRRMAELPLHPRLACLVAAGERSGVARDACRIAALLSEKDIRFEARAQLGGGFYSSKVVSGPSDAIELLDRFDEASSGELSRHRLEGLGLELRSVLAVDRTRQRLEQLARDASPPPPGPEAHERALRQILLGAFADRVAQRRSRDRADLVLANGSMARLSESSVVQHAEFMVLLDATSQGRGLPIVRLASAVEPEWLLDLPRLISEKNELRWNRERERVEQIYELRAGAIVLDQSESKAQPSTEASDVLRSAAHAKGIHAFDPNGALASLAARLHTVQAHFGDVALGGDVDELSLLTAACEGKTSFAELLGEDLAATAMQGFDPNTRRLLHECAPEHVVVGVGRRVSVHYSKSEPPWIESRLQDFFGQSQTPTICRGRLPLTLHLLAPNQRAVQVTSDLSGFWERHYPKIRKELSRRYPKHAWPEDGRTAAPPAPRAPRR